MVRQMPAKLSPHTTSERFAVRRLVVLALLCLAATVERTARAEDGQGILDGVAAIISAGAPAVVAGIQAGADKKIAAINADAAIAQAQIVSATAIDLTKMQADVAIAQSLAAQAINQTNQDGVTQRLQMQLDELRAAREDARQAERERLRMQYMFDQERIMLAREQAAANLDLARTAMKLQITQAGLANGVTNTFGPGNGLTVTRATDGALVRGNNISSGTLPQGTQSTGQNLASVASDLAAANRASARGTAARPTPTPVAAAIVRAPPPPAVRAPPPMRVASVGPRGAGGPTQLLTSFLNRGSAGRTIGRGVRAAVGEGSGSWSSLPRTTATAMSLQLAQGSRADQRFVSAPPPEPRKPALARIPVDAPWHRTREPAADTYAGGHADASGPTGSVPPLSGGHDPRGAYADTP